MIFLSVLFVLCCVIIHGEREVVIPKPAQPNDATNCKDVSPYESCRMWAGHDLSGCSSSPGHMALQCSKTCSMCHLRNAKTRCDPLQNDDVALQPGGLHLLFQNLTAHPKKVFDDYGNLIDSEDEFIWSGRNRRQYTVHKLSSDPWVIAIDNVLSDQETDEMINIAHTTGFEGSTTTGEVDETGTINRMTDQDRTSMQAWCQGACDSEPLVNILYDRIAELTTVPSNNFEHLQLLKYEIGQKYGVHHDLLGLDPIVSACGPRILTFFLYLSDVEEGGETHFPELNMEVIPRKGRAVLWTNVHVNDYDEQEYRTMHEAKAVIRGRKYAANAWIHLKDYRFVNLWACSG